MPQEPAAAETITSAPPAVTVPDDEDDDLPRPGKVWDGPSLKDLLKQQASATPVAPPPPPASNVEVVDPSNLPGVWQAMLGMLAKHGPGLSGLLSHGQLVAIEDGRAVIRYGSQHASLLKMFDKNGKKEQVRDAITRVLNQQVGVAFELGPEPAQAAPAAPPEAVPRPRVPAPGGAAAPAAPAVPPPAPSIRITPELVQTLRQSEPLIRDLMDKLGTQIVKVE